MTVSYSAEYMSCLSKHARRDGQGLAGRWGQGSVGPHEAAKQYQESRVSAVSAAISMVAIVCTLLYYGLVHHHIAKNAKNG